ncbi:MAG: ParB/RepB/Spo0J family partition protein [Verrucomicrobiota bacterium]|nr:ParB/RepB/Spo0J family partition protein [Verrucomicrobiota bacterium]
MAKPALGRGLGALMGGAAPVGRPPAAPSLAPVSKTTPETAASPPPAADSILRVPVVLVKPCAFQPRKDFSEESLRELADSIRAEGILQPLIVRSRNGIYELIAGERRWRAAQMAGIPELPVIVREADDRQLLQLALIENLQRENLNPIEEALGYSDLIRQFKFTQEEVALKVGKSRVAVANALRLINLDPEVQSFLKSGLITVGHAKAILGISNVSEQKVVANRVIREQLNVRQTEELVANLQKEAAPGQKNKIGNSSPDVHIAALQTRLQEKLGTKVLLRYRKGKGAVEIRFFSDDDLDRVLESLGVKME